MQIIMFYIYMMILAHHRYVHTSNWGYLCWLYCFSAWKIHHRHILRAWFFQEILTWYRVRRWYHPNLHPRKINLEFENDGFGRWFFVVQGVVFSGSSRSFFRVKLIYKWVSPERSDSPKIWPIDFVNSSKPPFSFWGSYEPV